MTETSKRVLSWLPWSLAVPAGIFLITAAVMSIPPNTQGIDVAGGHELFTNHCGSCHFVEPGFPSHHGPNLHDIGRTAGSRKPNQSASEYILESILDPAAFVAPSGRPGMPPNVAADLHPDEVRNIVGYLASCDAFPDYSKIKNLDVPDRRREKAEPAVIRLKDMQLAENVLREKGSCIKCHSFFAVPEATVFAPALFGAGLRDNDLIHESLIDPNKEIKPKYKSVTVLLETGLLVTGQLISRDDQQLVLCTRDEQNQLELKHIPLAEIEKEDGQPMIRESKVSLMPTGFNETLTREELDALINLIRQLN